MNTVHQSEGQHVETVESTTTSVPVASMPSVAPPPVATEQQHTPVAVPSTPPPPPVVINPEVREMITKAHEHQIFYAEFAGKGGQRYSGVCQVKQVIKKTGHNGETFAIVRFHGDNRMLRLGWRDTRILAIKPLELENLEAYFVHRERERVKALSGASASPSHHQMNMETSVGGSNSSPTTPARRVGRPVGSKNKTSRRGLVNRGKKVVVAPKAPPPPPEYAQYPSPAEAFNNDGGVANNPSSSVTEENTTATHHHADTTNQH